MKYNIIENTLQVRVRDLAIELLHEARRADLAAPSAPAEGQPITMTYRNYRGEVADRTVTPKRIWWGSTDWHPEPGWLMTAYDPDKQADRDFALSDADFRRVAPSAPAEVEGLVDALRSYQQADMDGVIVKVSRQACEEAATAMTALQAEIERLRSEVAAKAEAVADKLADALHHMVNASIHPDQMADEALAAYAKLKGDV